MTLLNGTEMTCADFDNSFNGYVDDLLEPADAAAARRHVAKCMTCNREVMRWQQTRILLSTAVADFATAVDLSSVRSGVEAALGFTAEDARRASVGSRDAEYQRGEAIRPAASRRAAGRRSASRRGSVVAAFRFASAAAVSAAVAAGAVLTFSPQPDYAAQVASSATAASSRSTYEPAAFRFGARNVVDVAPAAYTRPPLARPETPQLDALEAAPGHLVSTWIQPRTNARVIWVQDRGMGAPIRTAGLDR